MAKGHSFSIGFEIRGGRLVTDRPAITAAVLRWPDCEGVLTLEQDEAKRTLAANRYLWGPIYTAIADYTGQDKQDIHDEMKARFTARTVSYANPKTGEVIELVVVTGTSRMKVSEFHAFVQQVKLFAAEFFGLTFEDEPEEMRREYQRAMAREKKEKAA